MYKHQEGSRTCMPLSPEIFVANFHRQYINEKIISLVINVIMNENYLTTNQYQSIPPKIMYIHTTVEPIMKEKYIHSDGDVQ